MLNTKPGAFCSAPALRKLALWVFRSWKFGNTESILIEQENDMYVKIPN